MRHIIRNFVGTRVCGLGAWRAFLSIYETLISSVSVTVTILTRHSKSTLITHLPPTPKTTEQILTFNWVSSHNTENKPPTEVQPCSSVTDYSTYL